MNHHIILIRQITLRDDTVEVQMNGKKYSNGLLLFGKQKRIQFRVWTILQE
jgi:hypothetical protein